MTADEDRLLRAAEVQAQLGMSRANVYRLMRDNILPSVRIGGSVRVPKKALTRWIAENTRPGRKATTENSDQ
jgi:excisionase family DNA binding protein